MKQPTRVIIAGMPRSGTTLLAAFLAAQPGVRFVTDYIATFQQAAEQLGVGLGEKLDADRRKVALMMVRDRFVRLGHPVLVTPEQFTSVDELHRQVMAELAGDDARIAGHKAVLEPWQIRSWLAETDAHCVVLLRDPRDAALSFWYRTGGGVEDYVERWNEMSRSLRESSHPRLHTLYFESLLQDAEATLQPLEEALRLDFDWDVGALHFEPGARQRRTAWDTNSAFEDVGSAFDSAAALRWPAHLNSSVVRYASWAARRELAARGYPRLGDRLRLNERFRYHVNRLGVRSERRVRDSAHWFGKSVVRRLMKPLGPGER